MNAKQVKKDIWWVGVKDWNLVEFHGYSTPRGSTYNSYLIMDDKITLVDGVKHYLSDEMIARVKSVTDFSKIAYVVVNHVEMDHSGNIPEVMKLAPQAVIITNAAGKRALDEHFDTSNWQFQIIKTGDTVSIGKRTLSFVTTPMLHWPDSMMTYIAEEKLLLSNDGFGQHYCTDALFVKEAPFDVVMDEAKRYYANILFPYGAQAQKALNTAHDLKLDIEMIAPSHGCIWQGEEVKKILDSYCRWSSGENQGKAVVVYDTMWGATAKMAEVVTSVFEDTGIPVVKRCLSMAHISDVITDFMDAKYVAIGTPTLNNELFPRVAAFVTYMKGLQPKNKKAFAFASYGWKPGVVNQIQAVYEQLGWETIPPFEEKYTPKADVLEKLKEHVKTIIA